MKTFRANVYGVEIEVKAKDRKSFENKLNRMRREAFSFNEHTQPTMQKISRLVYEMRPCEAIEHVMSLQCSNTRGLNCQLKEMVDGVESWISENREHIEIFARFVNGFNVRYIDQYSIAIDGLLNVNPDAEKRYFDSAITEDEKRIRIKVLAAIGVYIQNAFLKCSTEDNDAAAVGCHMFFLFRSFVQFASCSIHRKGIKHTERSQEGGKSTKSRKGYLALIRHVYPTFPQEKASAPAVWERIISSLLAAKRVTSYNGSKFYVERDVVGDGLEHVALREERGGKKYIPIKFNTFRAIYSKLESEHFQMEK